MTEAEKAQLREVHARRQVGYDYIQAERDRELTTITTSEEVFQLRGAFRHAATLPMRASSGFVEFYQALAKVR